MNQIKKTLFLIFVAIFFLSLCGANKVFASSFSVVVSPKNPIAGTQVRARVESYNFDVDRANILWKIDGVTVSSGTGKTKIDFTSPELGGNKQIDVFVATLDGKEDSQSVVVVGNDIDILWQSMTYTPVWYRGKALPVRESRIKMTAIPHLFDGGNRIKKDSLVYDWSLNYKKDFNASGAGKDSFVFGMVDYGDYLVSVYVSNRDESVSFEKTITVNVGDIEPKIIFYEKSPLEGVRSNIALGKEFSLQGGEVGIKAEPYYFSDNDMGRLSYKWRMNGREVFTSEAPNILSLRSSGQIGVSRIGVKIRHLFNILQFASKDIKINY